MSTNGTTEESTTIGDRWTPFSTQPPIVKEVFHAAIKNNLTAVKTCVEERGLPINTVHKDDREKTLALVAAKYGHLPILKYVLEKNSTLLNIHDKDDESVMQHAIQRGDLAMVKYLVEEQKADICAIDHICIHTAVHLAALEGQLEILKYFIEERKADVNLRNLNGETLIFSAAEKPFMFVFMYLIEDRKADPTLVDVTEDNVMYKSAENGDVSIPKYLLDTKKVQFDINKQNTKGFTLLNWASRWNSTALAKYLLTEKKADANIPNKNMRRTALYWAAKANNVELCKLLVEHGAKKDFKDINEHTPAEVATDPELVTFLNSTTTGGSRKRRSLSETIDIPRQEVSMIKNRIGNIYQYHRLVSGSGNNQETVAQQAIGANTANALDGFLTVIDAAVRYFLGSSIHPPVENLQSPQEYLSSRVDPVAEHAINELPIFQE